MTEEPLKPRALVIDDDLMTANTLAQILQLNGFETTALYSGEQAMDWVESIRPDIVLSDIFVQQVNGIETAVRIRNLHPEVRIILFTASSIGTVVRERIEELGFEFLQRPLHPNDVLALLRA
jgi:DNA-binding NtrC family response regulator